MLAACSSPPGSPTPARASLAAAESLYADLRTIRDKIDVSIEAGRTGSTDAILTHNAVATTWPGASPGSTRPR
jgi:hypothetical protein